MNLVTVVCQRDYANFNLQIESVGKFLKPCTHHIIINDDLTAESFINWQKKIEEAYYSAGHQIRFYNQENFIPLSGSGWQKQQVYKFLISKYINDDYLILDSKNFFIRPCSVEDWKNSIGSGFHETVLSEKWEEVSRYYAENFFNTDPLRRSLSVQTPFMFHKKYLDKLKNIDEAMRFFNSKDLNTLHSEFLFYSYLIEQPLPATGAKHKTFWKKSDINRDLFEILIEQYNLGFSVLGLHRNFLVSLNELEITKIDAFLEFLDLNFRFSRSKLYP